MAWPALPKLHPHQRSGSTVAARLDRAGSVAGRAEAEALVEAACPRIVLEHVEPEPLDAPLVEDERADRAHRLPAEAATRRVHDDAQQSCATVAAAELGHERE